MHQLADLKALLGQHIHMAKLLSKSQAIVSVHDILTFMFNVVLINMYRPKWKPLFGETVNNGNMPNEAKILENQVSVQPPAKKAASLCR